MKKRIVTLSLRRCFCCWQACSGGGEESSSTALNVVVAATYVDDSMVEGLKTELATLTDYPDITISTVAMGDSEADPMGTMAGMAKLSGMMAAGEVDVLITDADNARRYGDNGESYIALSELFTEEELAALSAEATGVPVLDDEGQETGETSAACGFILSENASALTGLVDMRIFVVRQLQKKRTRPRPWSICLPAWNKPVVQVWRAHLAMHQSQDGHFVFGAAFCRFAELQADFLPPFEKKLRISHKTQGQEHVLRFEIASLAAPAVAEIPVIEFAFFLRYTPEPPTWAGNGKWFHRLGCAGWPILPPGSWPSRKSFDWAPSRCSRW